MLTRTTTVPAALVASAAALLTLSAFTHAADPTPTPTPTPTPAPAAPAKKDDPKHPPADPTPHPSAPAAPADTKKDAAPSAPADTKKETAPPAPAAPPTPVSPSVLDFKVKRIDGTEEDLSIYRGRVVLIVNVASKCGFTKQYEGLQKLYESKKDVGGVGGAAGSGGAGGGGGGLVILGFPANDFRNQEPGSNKDIAEFCSTRFHVTFPMYEKITVTGKDAHPLYKLLAAQPAPIGGEGVPGWNFTKFLVDRQGHVVARFDSTVAPDDPALVKKIDELLGGGAEKK